MRYPSTICFCVSTGGRALLAVSAPIATALPERRDSLGNSHSNESPENKRIAATLDDPSMTTSRCEVIALGASAESCGHQLPSRVGCYKHRHLSTLGLGGREWTGQRNKEVRTVGKAEQN